MAIDEDKGAISTIAEQAIVRGLDQGGTILFLQKIENPLKQLHFDSLLASEPIRPPQSR